jgi:hypothetical protein
MNYYYKGLGNIAALVGRRAQTMVVTRAIRGTYHNHTKNYTLTTLKYAQCYITANLRSKTDNKNKEEKETVSFVNLYPNPNDGSMQLEYEFADNLPGVFEMYDFTGRKVFSLQLNQSSGRADISAMYLSRGIYMYRLVSENVSLAAGKVVIIK